MTRRIVVLALALLAGPALAQTAPAPLPAPLPRVAIETTVGRIVVELEIKKAPITAANFLRYVDQKRLDGITFYRVSKVADHFGFVQFGISGDPKRALPPIKHESTTLTGIRHLDGTLSLPRRAPGTGQGEFTIMLGDQPSLDADPTKPGDNLGYAAFGRVVEGMDVLLKVFDAPVNPAATVRGSFKGEVPAAPVKVLTARRVKG
ncbi:MAG: peptidylprolyl isomerase [Pseudomonadota bacterium]